MVSELLHQKLDYWTCALRSLYLNPGGTWSIPATTAPITLEFNRHITLYKGALYAKLQAQRIPKCVDILRLLASTIRYLAVTDGVTKSGQLILFDFCDEIL